VSVEAVYSNGHKTVLALLDLGAISAKLVLIAQSPSDRLGVVDSHSRYLACSDPSRAQRLERVGSFSLVPGPERVRSEGVDYYTSSQPIPGTDWRALYLRAAADADAPVTAFVESIVSLMVAALICTAAIAFVAWRKITAILSSFMKRIARIAEGHYSERIEGDFYPEFRDIGRAFNVMADSIGKRDRELLRSEERYRLLFECNKVPAIIVHPDNRAIRDANAAAMSYYGYSKDEIVALRLDNLDETRPEILAAQFLSVLRGEEGRFLTRHRLRSGEIRDVELYASPVGLAGESALYCVVFDVTQRRLAEERMAKALEERTVLLREVYHRVKNNLQIISSLLNLQTDGIEEKTTLQALRQAQDRVFAMSLAHELVYQMTDLSSIEAAEYADGLVANLQAAYGLPERSVLVELKEMKLGLERAIPFGLALNELVSNAFKYAKPSPDAPVRVILDAGGDGWAVFTVEDQGPGIPEAIRDAGSRSGSLGLSLITALAGQLGAMVSWNLGSSGVGTRAEIRFPIEDTARS
jgi:PAS domain S-box-containing protein